MNPDKTSHRSGRIDADSKRQNSTRRSVSPSSSRRTSLCKRPACHAFFSLLETLHLMASDSLYNWKLVQTSAWKSNYFLKRITLFVILDIFDRRLMGRELPGNPRSLSAFDVITTSAVLKVFKPHHCHPQNSSNARFLTKLELGGFLFFLVLTRVTISRFEANHH